MMTLSEILFAPLEGEEPGDAEERIEANKVIFRNALSNPSGKALVELLSSLEPPYAPRFTGDTTTHHAAVRDGRREVVALLAMAATNE